MTIDARAFICGCAGLALTTDERDFIKRFQPWGLILFKRNIGSPSGVSTLTASFREIVGRADAPVLIDQEGGRVQRMGPPHWPEYPAAATLARIADRPEDHAALAASLMATDLRAVGVTVDCLPVLDVPAMGGHKVIGDRAYGAEPASVARFGRAVAEAMLQGGVLPVIKHIPGHGRAMADSHLELPVVTASRAELEAVDFPPFRALADMPLAMTAHVVYTALDPAGPATTSPRVVEEIIRNYIGFDGLLMSDDMSMKALKGSFEERAAATFRAGVDVALHCNGVLAEATPVAKASPFLGGRSLERAERALKLISGQPRRIDPVDARARLESALATVA
jgi:beta-N-acetylhexosaminidase